MIHYRPFAAAINWDRDGRGSQSWLALMRYSPRCRFAGMSAERQLNGIRISELMGVKAKRGLSETDLPSPLLLTEHQNALNTFVRLLLIGADAAEVTPRAARRGSAPGGAWLPVAQGRAGKVRLTRGPCRVRIVVHGGDCGLAYQDLTGK